MSEPQVILPAGWPRPKGYANGVSARGRMVFVAGMIGWDAQGVFPSDEFAAQARQALEAEAQAQALCMLTNDFRRAYTAFVAKQKPRFEGN